MREQRWGYWLGYICPYAPQDDSLDAIHVGVRVKNLVAKSYGTMVDASQKLTQSNLPMSERAQASRTLAKDFAFASLKRGVTVEINDVSVRHHGLTVGDRAPRLPHKRRSHISLKSPPPAHSYKTSSYPHTHCPPAPPVASI